MPSIQLVSSLLSAPAAVEPLALDVLFTGEGPANGIDWSLCVSLMHMAYAMYDMPYSVDSS